jgi:Zn-finger nucleic acid-binding protein
MEFSRMEIIQLELKYCERCGGLWLRRHGAAQVYCASCALEMPEYALMRKPASHPRLPVNHKRDVHGRFTVIAGFRGAGGHA